MPSYGYSCTTCGDFDVVRPMAQSTSPAPCPRCGSATRRRFGNPALTALAPELRRSLDASAASAEAPRVVTSVPGRSRHATPTTRDPRHARLPRP